MQSLRFIPAALLLSAACAAQPAVSTPGTFASGQYRDLFREYLGRTDAQVEARLDAAWQQLFHGDPRTERLYYPEADGTAYITDVANRDVRTEGLSYGMMIAVQMNHQEEFNRIWSFACRHMRHTSGPFRGYFAWHTGLDGWPLSPDPACDGEEWFAMALFFASHRWGDGEGLLDYEGAAQDLLHTMLHKHEEADRGTVEDMFDPATKLAKFEPGFDGALFTDPSYQLPAFYELWALWARDPGDRAFFAAAAQASRAFFRKAANPRTGLMPDFAEFDGSPHVERTRWHEDFRYDAWRTLSNPAIDYAWWGADPWTVEQSNRVLRFLASQGRECPDQFRVDGTPIPGGVNSPGLAAMAATAALAADREAGLPFVRRLWNQRMPEGRYRYYDDLLTMLALLEVGGHFRIYSLPPSR
jgi:oligosaccharide reducing-end xylanase